MVTWQKLLLQQTPHPSPFGCHLPLKGKANEVPATRGRCFAAHVSKDVPRRGRLTCANVRQNSEYWYIRCVRTRTFCVIPTEPTRASGANLQNRNKAVLAHMFAQTFSWGNEIFLCVTKNSACTTRLGRFVAPSEIRSTALSCAASG